MADNISLVQWTPGFQNLINGINNNPNRHNLTRRKSSVSIAQNTFGGGDELQVAIPALITAGNATDGFSVTLYGNGVDNTATGTATGVMAIDMAIADSACVGEYVVVFSNTITVTAWSE